jgi:hypothetical protein
MRSSKWFSVCAISLFASIAGNAMAAAATGGVASYATKAMAKKVGGQQLFVARGGNATKAGPPKTFSFATGSARDACAAKFDGRKEGLLVVAIKWTLDAQKRSTVTFCGLTAAKKKLPVGEEPNAASKAVKKTEDAEEQPEEKA